MNPTIIKRIIVPCVALLYCINASAQTNVTEVKDAVLRILPAYKVVFTDTAKSQYLERKYVLNTDYSGNITDSKGNLTTIEIWAVATDNGIQQLELQGSKEQLQLLQNKIAMLSKYKLHQTSPLLWQLQ